MFGQAFAHLDARVAKFETEPLYLVDLLLECLCFLPRKATHTAWGLTGSRPGPHQVADYLTAFSALLASRAIELASYRHQILNVWALLSARIQSCDPETAMDCCGKLSSWVIQQQQTEVHDPVNIICIEPVLILGHTLLAAREAALRLVREKRMDERVIELFPGSDDSPAAIALALRRAVLDLVKRRSGLSGFPGSILYVHPHLSTQALGCASVGSRQGVPIFFLGSDQRVIEDPLTRPPMCVEFAHTPPALLRARTIREVCKTEGFELPRDSLQWDTFVIFATVLTGTSCSEFRATDKGNHQITTALLQQDWEVPFKAENTQSDLAAVTLRAFGKYVLAGQGASAASVVRRAVTHLDPRALCPDPLVLAKLDTPPSQDTYPLSGKENLEPCGMDVAESHPLSFQRALYEHEIRVVFTGFFAQVRYLTALGQRPSPFEWSELFEAELNSRCIPRSFDGFWEMAQASKRAARRRSGME